jgi:hypothetical protein
MHEPNSNESLSWEIVEAWQAALVVQVRAPAFGRRASPIELAVEEAGFVGLS